MKTCPYCRNIMATGQTICDMCGELVPDVEPTSKKSIALKPRKAPTQIQAQPVDNTASEKKYKMGLGLIIAGAGAIVIAGVIIALVIFL